LILWEAAAYWLKIRRHPMINTNSDLRGTLENVRAEVEEGVSAAQDATVELSRDLVTTVRQNPVTSLAVAVAVAIGFALGLIARR
jgi:ElaB/YqjD/DUF883 family membrane-anchored ribosome-binding protein